MDNSLLCEHCGEPVHEDSTLCASCRRNLYQDGLTPRDFDFACSQTWRSYYNERYGQPVVDYWPSPLSGVDLSNMHTMHIAPSTHNPIQPEAEMKPKPIIWPTWAKAPKPAEPRLWQPSDGLAAHPSYAGER